MTFTTYRNPTLVDFLTVCTQITADQRNQLEVLTGDSYSAENTAAHYFQAAGPKWVLCEDDTPVAVAGFTPIRPGVWQDWMITTDRCWEPDAWRATTRHTRKALDSMLTNGAHRLQCVSLASRTEAHKWYRLLGLEFECTLRGYGSNGEDAFMFSRVRKQ